MSWDPAEEETCSEKVVNEVEDATDALVNRSGEAERTTKNV